MARFFFGLFQEIQNSLFVCVFVFIVILGTVQSALVGSINEEILKNSLLKNDAYIDGDASSWYHCPQGWTLHNAQCYKITKALLSWVQAQALCSSYGGNLVIIKSQCEQDWVGQFVSEQFELDGSQSNQKNTVNDNTVDSQEIWIGFLRLPDGTFQWSNGQPGVEQDGFWALDGLLSRESLSKPDTRLCSGVKPVSPNSKDFRWHLTDCKQFRPSLCMLQPCEEHSLRCADGSGCVGRVWMCDGYRDCPDGSDEENCDNGLLEASTSSSQHCGSVIKGDSGTLHSPNFPEVYPPFSNCVWKIEVKPSYIVEIEFESLDIEEKYDTLKIYDGMGITDKPLLASLDGSLVYMSVRSTSSFMTVHFVSDYSNQSKGFNATWKSVKPERLTCGEELIAGDIKRLVFPDPRRSPSQLVLTDVKCEWLISSPNKEGLLSLQFLNTTLEGEDSITIYDGRDVGAPVISHINSSHIANSFSGSQTLSDSVMSQPPNIPPVIVSSGQHLFISISTTQGSSSSFVLIYKDGCDVPVLSNPSLILSPGYTNSLYPNNLNCSWTVPKNISRSRLTLLFLPDFYTEGGKDYLQIYISDVQLTSPLMTASGPLVPNGISSSQGLFLNFVSDSTVNHGRWAAVISHDCDSIPVLSQLMLNMTDRKFGTTVRFSCSEGFKLIGPSQSVCWLNGQWLPSEFPRCEKISCNSPPVPDKAYLTQLSGKVYGSKAVFQCFFGHFMVGSNTSICGKSGWENVPSCDVITCPKERPPDGGNARAEDIKYGTLREYFCFSGHRLIGSKFSHCGLFGNWTDEVPVCEVLHCPALHGVFNGRVNDTGPIPVGKSVAVVCNKGYQPNGAHLLTCLDNLQYDHLVPSCIDIDECNNTDICGPHLCQNFAGGHSCFCQEGYHHLSNNSQNCIDVNECDENNGDCSHMCVNLKGGHMCECPSNLTLYKGQLDYIGNITLVPEKTCIATCMPLIVANGGQVIYKQHPLSNGSFLHETEARVRCPSGHHPNGAAVVWCVAGSGWSSTVTHCDKSLCNKPEQIGNGKVLYTNQSQGSSASYTCNHGYVLRGSAIRFCVARVHEKSELVNIEWSGRSPHCDAVTCPRPKSPSNGTVDFGALTYKSVAVYRCKCGYKLVGQSVVSCNLNGSWSDPVPFCEVQSCTHPGLPVHATLTNHTPGFPVGSNVSFTCNKKGYQLTDNKSLTCLPVKESKVSSLLPWMAIGIKVQLIPRDSENLKIACLPVYAGDLIQFIKQWYKGLASNCKKYNVELTVRNDNKPPQAVQVISRINITAHLQLMSENVSATCLCGTEILASLKLSRSGQMLNKAYATSEHGCPAVVLKHGSALDISNTWHCPPGLRLQGGDHSCASEKAPVCMADCVDKGIETFERNISGPVFARNKTWPLSSLNKTTVPRNTSGLQDNVSSQVTKSLQETSLKITTASPMSDSLNSTTTSSWFSSLNGTSVINTTVSVKPTSKSNITSSLKYSVADTTIAKSPDTNTQTTVTPRLSFTNITLSTTSPYSTDRSSYTETTESSVTNTEPKTNGSRLFPKTTKRPILPFSLRPSWKSTTIPSTSLPKTETKNPSLSQETTQSFGITSPGILESDADFFGNNKPKEELWMDSSNGHERVSATDNQNRKPNDSPTRPSNVNCTGLRPGQGNRSASVPRDRLRNDFGGRHDRQDMNMSDCLTTHTLEKQEVTMVQGPSVPTLDLTSPVYSVEVRDEMTGSFNNITCIDSVHISINAKVNELLREFGSKMGKLVCRDAPDSSLELAAGNIRFKGTTARVFIKFSIVHSVSSKARVEACASEFHDYVTAQLPKKFERVAREVPLSDCKFVEYTVQSFNVSLFGWTCHNGYTLEHSPFQCIHILADEMFSPAQKASSMATLSSVSPTPVLNVPRLSIPFAGAFTTPHPHDKVDIYCMNEYRAGLLAALTQIEPHLQSKFHLCSNIYIDITRDLTVSRIRNRIVSVANIHMVPLHTSMTLNSIKKCAKFISLQFREPSEHLPSVTLTRKFVPTCPEISLSPHGLRSNMGKIKIFCPEGYIYNDYNFKCIDEKLPIYNTGIEIMLTGAFRGPVCEKSLRDSAFEMVNKVTKGIQDALKNGLCNTSQEIIILKKPGEVSRRQLEVTVFIPITLVSLHGSQSDSVDCAKNLLTYPSSAPSRPINVMADSLTQTCGPNILTSDYTVPYSRWSCFSQQIYNVLTHMCQAVSTHSSDTQTKGLSISGRQKRSATLYRPQWSSSLPQCTDVEPPVFKDCPDKPVEIIPTDDYTVPIPITIPKATDNSGLEPIITLIPRNFTPTYIFFKNITITVEARDASNNMAVCKIHVVFYDKIPPVIRCPTHLVTLQDESSEEYPRINYKNLNITAADNSGNVAINFNPPNGTWVRSTEVFEVTAKAVDGSLNVANCSFFARVEPKGCPNWSLIHPRFGGKKCTKAGTKTQGTSCAMYCDQGMGFAVEPPEQYVCAGGGRWIPQTPVPQCVRGIFPDYELYLTFNLSKPGNTTEECMKNTLAAIQTSVKEKLDVACQSDLNRLNITYEVIESVMHRAVPNRVVIQMKISIQALSNVSKNTSCSHHCCQLEQNRLVFQKTLDTGCGKINLTSPEEVTENETCSVGMALSKGMCYECPPGSFWENFQCFECPKGMFQNSSGSSSCMVCGTGHSTLYKGARHEEECLAECGKNEFSLSGLVPCVPCPVGSYQLLPGSTSCKICTNASVNPYCKELCPVGHHSPNGTLPCKPCPLNYYSPVNGSVTCIECPQNKLTEKEGASSVNQCIEKNPCQENPCMNRGKCEASGRKFTCECKPGFKGQTCQTPKNECASQPCLHNGTCQSQRNGFWCTCQKGFKGRQCERVMDHCLSNPCVHGLCVNTPSGFQCNCHKGFEGKRCETNSNECSSVPCLHNGTCIDLISGFFCLCKGDYTGTQCKQTINDCEINYCLNAGTCVDGNNSFTCSCPPGFTGELCESQIDLCDDFTCQNDGICQHDINATSCLCQPGYTGKQCEIEIDPCESNPCLHNGDCISNQSLSEKFECQCQNGYTGERCENDIDECNPLQCNLGGTVNCTNDVASFTCNCLPGWEGSLCDKATDPCSSASCDNGGTCVSQNLTFTCLCPPLYTGPSCSIALKPCESSPCQNKGKCVDKGTDFVCECPPGFTCSLCEENIDDCLSQPCRNGGLCEDGVNWFTCKCPKGFTGDLCQVDIDECLSQPCQHNSSCRKLDGDFHCDCVPGFTGKQCDIDIQECLSQRCENGGTCIDEPGSYHCVCPPKYSGPQCEELLEGCSDEAKCLNGATCQKHEDEDICVCTPFYTGPDCGKEKTPNFDLHFHGDLASSSFPPPLTVGNLTILTICLWIRFTEPFSQGIYLVVSTGDGVPLLTLRGSQAISPMFNSQFISLHANDGNWHHLCFIIGECNWTVYKNGESFLEGEIKRWELENRLKVTLGQLSPLKGEDEKFQGHLHGVNIYSAEMDVDEITNMSQNCHLDLIGGDVFNWVITDSFLHGDVEVVMPSQCGKNPCIGGLCSIVSDADKVPPVVTQCPSLIVITSKTGPLPVSWMEPEFSDNVGVVSVKQNFRSGQTFTYGQYLVTYIAYDANNNSAECNFHIFVRRFDCLDPPPPTSGARVCGEWHHGRYCIPSCMPRYRFVSPVPPFYRCGHEGVWDPPNGDPFVFPACASIHSPAHTIFGSAIFKGPACTSAFQRQLHDKLVRILTQLDNVLGLCEAEEVCNYSEGLNIQCDREGATRERRAAFEETADYSVEMNINMTSSLENKILSVNSISEEIVHAMKHGPLDEFSLSSVDLQLTPHCSTGQVLEGGRNPQCLNCPAGYHAQNQTVCVPCPKGWYNSKPLQTSCIKCPPGLTTIKHGATSTSHCVEICQKGTFFNRDKSKCEKCPIGQYQDQEGTWHCEPCPIGLTTRQKGAKSVTKCTNWCSAGEELGVDGKCLPCPVGTYKTGRDSNFCTPCAYGWTTEGTGAVDESQCDLVQCEKGYYRNLNEKRCHPCPLGTFQPLKGARLCEPCGVGLTTEQVGANSKLLCVPGKVDECELKIDTCDSNSVCVDTEESYTCECKYGTTDTGQCIDICRSYCNEMKPCDDLKTKDESSDCHCREKKCKSTSSKTEVFQLIVIVSMSVTAVATLLLLVIIAVCIYRRNHESKEKKHVRLYREDRELVAFTNEAFESFSTGIHLDQDSGIHLSRDDRSLQVPSKMATRWHIRSFMSGSSSRDEVESTDL